MAERRFICRLLELPAAIAAAEEELLELDERRRCAQEALQAVEDALILAGVEGKNQEQRAAAVRDQTQKERERLIACEFRVSEAKIARGRLVNELSALKAVTRLLVEVAG
jgi:hypothetical protein